MRTLDPVPRRSLSGAVFEQLLERIVSGAFAADQPLPPERQLCEALGVSRTAVREALARLAQLRLIQVRHGGETRVLDYRLTGGLDLLPRLLRRADGSPQADVIRAGIEMRAALTPEIARLAALRADAGVLDTLDATVAEMAAAGSDALLVLHALSLRFWAAVVAGTDNVAYQLAFNSLRDAFGGLREAVAAAMAAELRDRKGYKAIADAIRRGDSDAAAKAARAHLALGAGGLATLTRTRKPRRPS